jgi:XTP/dITP diphosphohydrolase
MKILVATTNPGKIAEFAAMLDDSIEWLTLADFPDMDEVEEDGLTFADNARKKALGYAKMTGQWTVADDSGLCIDALDGAPGVHSARFSGPKLLGQERTLIDHRNITKVLDLLKDVPDGKRTARFVCNLCLASPEKVLLETEGTMEGTITHKETGCNGFGYDPILYIPSHGKTAAQLSANQKNAVSHRGTAIKNLKPLLVDLFDHLS